MTFDMIDLERRKLKIPVARLCQVAGVAARSYERIRAGAQKPRAATLARLADGLIQIRREEKSRPGREADRKRIFRLVLALFARDAGIDLRAALDHRAQQKATANETWLKISRIRDLTCYALNTVAGWSNADVADAAGVTPPAITNAIRKVVDEREDHPELEAVFSMFEAAVR